MRQRMRLTGTAVVLGASIILLAGTSPVFAFDGDGDFSLGGGTSFAVLFEGPGSLTVESGSTITGNIGIGSGSFIAQGPGTSTINGSIEFAAANSGQFSSSNTNYTPALSAGVNPLYSQSAVTSALNTINSLSTTLGGESGTSTGIGNGGSVTVTNGKQDSNGNYVFAVSSISLTSGHTFTINGTSSEYVVFNIAGNVGNPGLDGSIVLSGGITSDHVLFNYTGGNTMTIDTNGATTAGTFLDTTGAFEVTNSVIDGRVFGGDCTISGSTIDSPVSTPEPASLALLGTALLGAGLLLRRYRHN